MATIGEATFELRTDTRKFKQGLAGAETASRRSIAKIGASFQTLGRGISDVGKMMTLAFTVPVVAGFAAATVAALKFEKQMAEVRTLLAKDFPAASFEKLNKDVLSLSKEMGIATNEIVPALYQAISAGIPPENVIEFLRTGSKVAIGGVTDLETAIDGLTTITNAWGLSLDETSDIADIMFVGMKKGKTTIGEMSSFMFQAAPLASALAISAQEVVGSMAALTLTGTPTSVAMTQIRAAMIGIARENPDLVAALEKSGFATAEQALESEGLMGTLNLLNEAVGGHKGELMKMLGSQEAVMVALAASGDAGDVYAGIMDDMADRGGAANEAFEIMNRTSSRQFQIMKNKLIVTLTELGTLTLPLVTVAMGKATDILQVLMDSFLAFVGGLRAGVEEIDVTSKGIFGFAEAIGGATRALRTGDLAGAVELLGRGFEALRRAGPKETVIGLGIGFGGLLAVAGPVLLVGGKFIALFGTILTLLPKLGMALKFLAKSPMILLAIAIGTVIATNKELRDRFMELVSTIGDALMPIFRELMPVVQELFKSILAAAIPIIEIVLDLFLTWAETVLPPLLEILGMLAEKVLVPLLGLLAGLFGWLAENETAIKIVTIVLLALFVAMNPIPAAILGIITALLLLKKHWTEIVEAIEGAVSWVKDQLAAHWKEIVTVALAILFAPAAGLFLLVKNFDKVREGLQEVLQKIKDGLQFIWKLLPEDAREALEGIAETVTFWTDKIAFVFEEMFGFLRALFEFQLRVMLEIFDLALSFMSTMLSLHLAAFTLAFEIAFGVMRRIVETTLAVMQRVVETVMPVIEAIIDATLGRLVSLFQLNWDSIKQIMESVWLIIKTIVETQLNVIFGIVETVMALLRGDWEGAWTAIKDLFRDIWTGMVTVLREQKEILLAVVEILIASVRQQFGDLVEWMLRTGTRLVVWLQKGITAAWDAFIGWIRDRVTDLKNILDPRGWFSTPEEHYRAQFSAALQGIGDEFVNATPMLAAAATGAANAIAIPFHAVLSKLRQDLRDLLMGSGNVTGTPGAVGGVTGMTPEEVREQRRRTGRDPETGRVILPGEPGHGVGLFKDPGDIGEGFVYDPDTGQVHDIQNVGDIPPDWVVGTGYQRGGFVPAGRRVLAMLHGPEMVLPMNEIFRQMPFGRLGVARVARMYVGAIILADEDIRPAPGQIVIQQPVTFTGPFMGSRVEAERFARTMSELQRRLVRTAHAS